MTRRHAGPQRRPSQPTVFIECTHTFHSELNTGIQRVVRNVLRNAAAAAEPYGYRVEPVILVGEEFRFTDVAPVLADKQAARREAAKAGTAPPPPPPDQPPTRPGLPRRILRFGLRAITKLLPFESVRLFLYAPATQPGLSRAALSLVGRAPPPPRPAPNLDDFDDLSGSILLLLDSSWGMPIWPAVERFKARGGKVVSVIYDLIPITHTYTAVPDLVRVFTAWLASQARLSDRFVGISRSVADTVAGYMRPKGRRPLSTAPVDHFHLGSELDFVSPDDPVRREVQDIFAPPRHVFLMVGTIEPRKKHAYVLEAFERLWAEGGDAALLIVGRQAWKTEALIERMAEHPELGRRLFVLRDATDAELDHAYRNASSLVIASEIEGFGLPVVEAFQRGLRVMCSDIPVFRELADGRATFFDLADPARLTEALQRFLAAVDLDARKQRWPQAWIGWRESADQLMAAVTKVRPGETPSGP